MAYDQGPLGGGRTSGTHRTRETRMGTGSWDPGVGQCRRLAAFDQEPPPAPAPATSASPQVSLTVGQERRGQEAMTSQTSTPPPCLKTGAALGQGHGRFEVVGADDDVAAQYRWTGICATSTAPHGADLADPVSEVDDAGADLAEPRPQAASWSGSVTRLGWLRKDSTYSDITSVSFGGGSAPCRLSPPTTLGRAADQQGPQEASSDRKRSW